jgi:hypothetical protein
MTTPSFITLKRGGKNSSRRRHARQMQLSENSRSSRQKWSFESRYIFFSRLDLEVSRLARALYHCHHHQIPGLVELGPLSLQWLASLPLRAYYLYVIRSHVSLHTQFRFPVSNSSSVIGVKQKPK